MKKAIYLVMALLIGSAAGWASTITLTSGAGGVLTATTSFVKGGFTDTISLATVTPPAGEFITDLSASLSDTSITSGRVTLGLSLSNGDTISISSTPGHMGTSHITFSGVTSLGISGSLSGNNGAAGSTTIMLTPSFSTTTHPAPEPGSVTLVGLVLLLFIGLAGYSRRKVLVNSGE